MVANNNHNHSLTTHNSLSQHRTETETSRVFENLLVFFLVFFDFLFIFAIFFDICDYSGTFSPKDVFLFFVLLMSQLVSLCKILCCLRRSVGQRNNRAKSENIRKRSNEINDKTTTKPSAMETMSNPILPHLKAHTMDTYAHDVSDQFWLKHHSTWGNYCWLRRKLFVVCIIIAVTQWFNVCKLYLDSHYVARWISLSLSVLVHLVPFIIPCYIFHKLGRKYGKFDDYLLIHQELHHSRISMMGILLLYIVEEYFVYQTAIHRESLTSVNTETFSNLFYYQLVLALSRILMSFCTFILIIFQARWVLNKFDNVIHEFVTYEPPPKTTNGMSIIGDSNINGRCLCCQCNRWNRRISKHKRNSDKKKRNSNKKKGNDNTKTNKKRICITGTITNSQTNYASVVESSVEQPLGQKRCDLCNTIDLTNAIMQDKTIKSSVIEYTESEYMITPRSEAKRIKQNIEKERKGKGEKRYKIKGRKRKRKTQRKMTTRKMVGTATQTVLKKAVKIAFHQIA